jgi:SdrD B-like domain
LTSGECNSSYDAGISQILKASLGDKVWYDYNCNGIQNSGEPGVCGVTVTLFKCSDNTVVGTPKVTDSYGKYLFSNLVPGNYYVKFSNLPSGYSFSPKDVSGCSDALDSDADPYTGKTGCETLISGENNLTYDAGIIHSSKASLCDKVWYDNNRNGCQDYGEQGVPCVTVTLYRCSDNRIVCNSDITDGDGKYHFSGLPAGNYYVKFSNLPSGYSFCPQNRGNDDERDSDADPYTGKTGWYSLSSGQCRTSCDAGLVSSGNSSTNSNIGYSSEKEPVQGNVVGDASLVSVTAYPNPYTDRIVFTIKSSVSGNSSFELFDILGKKVATLYQGYFEKGTVKVITYEVPGASRSTLIYRFTNGNEIKAGKVISLN